MSKQIQKVNNKFLLIMAGVVGLTMSFFLTKESSSILDVSNIIPTAHADVAEIVDSSGAGCTVEGGEGGCGGSCSGE